MNMIVAMNKNKVIGNEGLIPWSLHTDLKSFKRITLNNIIVMGRKTYESIGKPLPRRINVILSRDAEYFPDGENLSDVYVIHNKEDLYDLKDRFGMDVFIIGGSEIYREFYDECNALYLTLVEDDSEGDTKIDCLDLDDWETYATFRHKKGDGNSHDFIFSLLDRKGVSENENQ